MKFALLIFSFTLLASCQANRVTSETESNVHHGIIKANKEQIVEICPELFAGQILSFELNASQPVLFNFHYHQDKEVTYPVPERNLTEIKYQYIAEEYNSYCLMWKTHLDSTKIKYQYRISR